MNFLHPGLALAAVAAIALPIVIHLLFRRRRIPLDWAAMEILREAMRRTNRRLRAEQWLVLVLRCLAVLALGLAIAVPVMSSVLMSATEPRTWMVVIDDGVTSALRTGVNAELARVCDDARQAVSQRRQGDRVGIVLASVPPRIVLAATADSGRIEEGFTRITAAQTPSDLSGALTLARGFISNESMSSSTNGPTTIIVASAFREASLPDGVMLGNGSDAVDRATTLASETEFVALTPAQESPVDVRLTSIEARNAAVGDGVSLRAQLMRAGLSLPAAETRVNALGDGLMTSPVRIVTWEAGQSEASVEFQLPATVSSSREMRQRAVEVRLNDDALSAGNSMFAVIQRRNEIEVAILGRRGALDASDLERVPASLWISRALNPSTNSGMRVRDLDPSACDDQALLGFDAVIVARPDLVAPSSCDALGRFVLRGGLVVIVPAAETLAQSWSATLLPKLSVRVRTAAEATVATEPLRLAEEQPTSALLYAIRPEIASLVAPLEVSRSLALEGFAGNEVVLTLANNAPFVVAVTPTNVDGTSAGLVVLFAATPELTWTNLPVKPLMVPLFQEIVRAGLGLASGHTGANVGERVKGASFTVLRADDGTTLTLGEDGRSREVVARAGVLHGDDGSMVAANISAATLGIAPSSLEKVRAAFAPLGGVRIAASNQSESEISSESTRSTWSFALLALALTTLLIEGVLSRAFSRASLVRAGRNDQGISTVGRVRGRNTARVNVSLGNPSASGIDANTYAVKTRDLHLKERAQ